MPQGRQVPVEVSDLARNLGIPEALVTHGVVGRDRGRVVTDAQVSETGHHRKERVAIPVTREPGEVLVQHVVKRVVVRVEGLDIAGRVQLLHEFGVREDDVVGARGRLGDQRQHVVATGVILGLELHIVGFLERAHDVGLAVAVPGEHVDLGRLRRCLANDVWRRQHTAGSGRGSVQKPSAGKGGFRSWISL